MTDTLRASLRTGWFAGILTAILGTINARFNWDLTVDDLLPFAPVVAIAAGVAYRASRVLADRWPSIGFVLFGSTKTPTYPVRFVPEVKAGE